jgi:NTP pyrophosphatase (non-canonical NTP hydrolase)
MIDLQKLQKEIWDNKLEKGFNTDDICLEFNLTYGELAEAFDAYQKKQDNVGEELADVAIYLLGLAKMLDVNLEDEVLKKMTKNKNRVYKKVDGVNIKQGD